MNDLSGTQLGQYQLIQPIGKGGMATVYRAHQPSMSREVAIKIIAPDLATDPEFMARFRREAQIVANLQHPHILPVYDFGQQDGLTYLVMRLMEGGSLDRELRAGPLPTPRVLELTRQIASALTYAHQRGIVHRDLKPTNILLDAEGSAYLTDFGIAKLMSGGPTVGLTATGAVMGTPTYMAPEQWRAEPVDGRTDIYALGVIVYQMLLGQVPFAAETPHGLMYQHLDMQPPAPHTLKPDLPLSIEPVVKKALAKNREDRFASPKELAAALETALHVPPARLPEQTDFDVERVDATVLAEDEYDRMAEEDLLAHAGNSARQVSQPTVPPTGALPPVAPPSYVPPPVTAPPVYTPPVYQPSVQSAPAYTPPPAPLSYAPPQPASPALGQWLWIGALGAVALIVVVAVVLFGAAALSSDGGETGDAAPTPTVQPTATVNPALLPRAAIQAPANGATASLGEAVTIQFAASAPNGVTRVELRRFGQVLDTVSAGGQASFQGSFSYTPDSTGRHVLEIVAWSGDLRGDPASVMLQVQ